MDLAHVEAYGRLASLIVSKLNANAFASRFSDRAGLKDDAMRPLVSRMGKWLLRGPLDDREVDSFLRVARAVANDGGDYDEAVRYAMEAMLESPRPSPPGGA